MKYGILLNISLWTSFTYSMCLIGKIQDKNNIYTSFVNSIEPYTDPDFLHQLHMHANAVICNDKSAVTEFTRWPMIVSIYDFSISDTYSFIFASQSMIVTTSPKAKVINEMACSLYPCGLLFGTNTIIARILVLSEFMQ